MNHKLIFDGLETEELIQVLEKSPTKKLIMELNHTYGLKVIEVTYPESGFVKEPDEFIMGYESNGLPICSVWTEKDMTTTNGIRYYFKTPFYEKFRGNSTNEKQTVFSSKLSSLMGTLKKARVVISEDDAFHHIAKAIESSRSEYTDSFGKTSKSIFEVDADSIHILLSKYIHNKEVEGLHLDLNLCKKALDKYNQADNNKLEMEKETKRFYEKPFYFIASCHKDIIIGVLKRKEPTVSIPQKVVEFKSYKGQIDKVHPYEIVEPLKRFKTFDDEAHGYIKGLLTMLKVSAESRIPKFNNDFIPYNHKEHFKEICFHTVAKSTT